ncbi:MAG: hypothetical protein ABS55_04630 [Lautropia sp. SCN 70-15]|nr:MAG: hypothetical protein ABS55_04630 [Lautropia sp. SCN 70-15]
MLHPHEIYGWQMSAHQALLILRRTGQADRVQARHLLSVLDSGQEAVPQSLAPLCERLYLMQVAPGNRLAV